MIVVTDALGRDVALDQPARRVVSLVPSETENVAMLAGRSRIVGRTDYCELPKGLEAPAVGGTKKFRVDAVLDLAPDLVLANKEENGRRDVERLIEAGLPVYVSFPHTVDETLDHVDVLSRLLGSGGDQACALRDDVRALPPPSQRLSVFVPIWRDPYMSFDARTYASDLLREVGFDNVYADRRRRFPLAADVGEAPAVTRDDADTRYPRTSLEEVAARAPEAVLFPDEPYAFELAHADELRASGLEAAVAFVCGKDLFWPGVRTARALGRLRRVLETLVAESS